MPIFEFECLECGAVFEKLVRTTNSEPEVACPRCGARELEEKLSTFASPAKGGFPGSSGGCAPSGG
jgi:putative FmdB family regulatory protein